MIAVCWACACVFARCIIAVEMIYLAVVLLGKWGQQSARIHLLVLHNTYMYSAAYINMILLIFVAISIHSPAINHKDFVPFFLRLLLLFLLFVSSVCNTFMPSVDGGCGDGVGAAAIFWCAVVIFIRSFLRFHSFALYLAGMAVRGEKEWGKKRAVNLIIHLRIYFISIHTDIYKWYKYTVFYERVRSHKMDGMNPKESCFVLHTN